MTTQSEVTLVNDSHSPGADLRASTRMRARVADTLGSAHPRRAFATIASDARSWHLYAARPPSLRTWLRAQRVDAARVPGDGPATALAWRVDNWTTGLALRGLALLLHLIAGGLIWLAGHPARRWLAFVITAFSIGWILYGR